MFILGLKEPGPIASDFFSPKLFEILVSEENSYFSHNPQVVNFTAEKCTVWKILMKM